MNQLSIVYENIPVGMMENSTTNITYAQDFVNMNDFKYLRNVPKYATLEEGRNLLDGTFINFPTSPQGYGYLSTIMSDQNGDFSDDIVITRTYAYNYSSPGLTIQFDTYTNDYPPTINVKWYRGSTLILENDYDVDQAEYFVDENVTIFNKIVITINKMTKPNRFLKIFNIADGTIRPFYNDEIENIEIIEEITSDNTALCINEASVKLLPLSSTGVLFQRTLPFMIYRNEVLFGKFYINSFKANTDKTIYDISLSNYIETLEHQTFYGEKVTNRSASLVFEDILSGTGVPYEIDNSFDNIYLDGYLEITNKREALRRALFAANAYVDTSRIQNLTIKPLPTTISKVLDESEIIYINMETSTIVTKYLMNKSALAVDDTATYDVLFDGVVSGDVYIYSNEPIKSYQVTGGTILDTSLYWAKVRGTGANLILKGLPYTINVITEEKTNPYTSTTDLEKAASFDVTLYSGDTLNNIPFVQYSVKSKFVMDGIKVGDLITLNDVNCRVLTLDYNLGQSEIYCTAELEVYYE